MKSRTRSFRSPLLEVLAILLLVGSGQTGVSVAAAPAGAGAAIEIGVVLPITGHEAKPGQYQREGIELANRQINQTGGIPIKSLGKKLPLREIFYDDGSDQARSSGLVERAMAADHVTAVLGGYSTALGEAESVMPDRYETPCITTGAAASTIFNRGYEWIFGTLSSTDLLGTTTAAFLGRLVDQGRLHKGLKLALVVENTDHGADYSHGIDRWIHDHPGYLSVVFNERFDLGGADYSGLLQKVKNAHADIFLADAHLQDYFTMHRQYVQAGLYHQMISYGARGPEVDARKALGAATDGIFAGAWWSSKLPYPQVKPLRRRLPGVHRPRSRFVVSGHRLRRRARPGASHRARRHAGPPGDSRSAAARRAEGLAAAGHDPPFRQERPGDQLLRHRAEQTRRPGGPRLSTRRGLGPGRRAAAALSD